MPWRPVIVSTVPFNLPQNPDTGRTVLGELDAVLVSLMGAVDVSARVAHMVLGIPGNAYNAAGRRTSPGWAKSLPPSQP